METAKHILEGVLRLNPNQKRPDLDKWANEIRLLAADGAGRTHPEIKSLFTWANQEPFWKAHILSPRNLREKWDKLTIKRQSETNGNHNGHANHPTRIKEENRGEIPVRQF